MQSFVDNLHSRKDLILKAHDNPELQQAAVEQCRQDIIFFFDFFLWTYNPKVPPYDFPFVLYPVQEDAARRIHAATLEHRGTLCEKSRETGATYIYLGVFLYHWLFLEFEGLLLSMREDEVDNITPSSMFGKIRYMVTRLPFWILPENYNYNHDVKKSLRLFNSDNDNTIVGQATTEDAGRSGRKTAVLIDEHAAINNRLASGIETSLSHTTDSIHRLSTPRGINLFKNIRDKKICDVITMHWTQMPPKCEGLYCFNDQGNKIDCQDLPYNRRSTYGFYINGNGKTTDYKLRSKWYDALVDRSISERDVAQEADIQYLGSGYCRFDSKMLESGSQHAEDGDKGFLIERGGEVVFREAAQGQDYEVEIWKFPERPYFNNRSFIGADTAEGLSHGDFCSADVVVKNIRGDKGFHAAALHGHFRPDIFAEKLALLGRFYDCGALIGAERNKDGLSVILRLLNDLDYTNLYHEDAEHQKFGIYTTDVKKALFTEALDKALREGELETRSISHFTEMSTFENVNGKLGATGTNFDDRVVSLFLAWFLFLETGKPRSQTEKSKPIQSILKTSKYKY